MGVPDRRFAYAPLEDQAYRAAEIAHIFTQRSAISQEISCKADEMRHGEGGPAERKPWPLSILRLHSAVREFSHERFGTGDRKHQPASAGRRAVEGGPGLDATREHAERVVEGQEGTPVLRVIALAIPCASSLPC